MCMLRPPQVTLTCTVEAHPIPTITWLRGSTPLGGQQEITSFMETPSSTLTVPVDENLRGEVEFTCRAVQGGRTVNTTTQITAFSKY